MNINFAVDKEWEDKTLKEIANAPVAALQGVSDRMAEHLYEALKVKTVNDLANNKFIRWAQAISTLADTEEKQ